MRTQPVLFHQWERSLHCSTNKNTACTVPPMRTQPVLFHQWERSLYCSTNKNTACTFPPMRTQPVLFHQWENSQTVPPMRTLITVLLIYTIQQYSTKYKYIYEISRLLTFILCVHYSSVYLGCTAVQLKNLQNFVKPLMYVPQLYPSPPPHIITLLSMIYARGL